MTIAIKQNLNSSSIYRSKNYTRISHEPIFNNQTKIRLSHLINGLMLLTLLTRSIYFWIYYLKLMYHSSDAQVDLPIDEQRDRPTGELIVNCSGGCCWIVIQQKNRLRPQWANLHRSIIIRSCSLLVAKTCPRWQFPSHVKISWNFPP